MKDLNLDKLKEHIAIPDWEARLVPLYLFKGTRPLHIRKFWNIAYAMYLTECDTYKQGIKLTTPDGDHGKLCGVLSKGPVQKISLRSAFSRMRTARNLTDSISKEFTEYIEYIHPGECLLDPVPLISYDTHSDRVAWWREKKTKPKKPKVWKPPKAKIEDRCYPYIRCETEDQKLVNKIYSMIPTTVPYQIRGDLCQDLLVDILIGDLDVDNIPNVLRKYITKARKFMPSKYRDISIDAMIPGTDIRYIERLPDSTIGEDDFFDAVEKLR